MTEHKHKLYPWKVSLPSEFNEYQAVVFYCCGVDLCEERDVDLVELADL